MMKRQIERSFCILLAVMLLIGLLPMYTVKTQALTPTYSVSSAYAATSYYDKLCAVQLTGNQRDDIINVALSQVGYTEGSYSGDYGGADDGSYLNYVEYNYWFNKCVSSSMPVGGTYAHWCATFVSWCAEQAGIPSSILNRSTAAGHSASYFNIYFYAGGSTLNASSDNNYHFLGYNYTPKKGDLFYTRSWSHVGLVVAVNGNYVTTVEGNTNDGGSADGLGVFRRTRAISDLYFGVPAYTEKEIYTPGTPAITGVQSTYTPGSSVTVRWNSTTHTDYYSLALEKMVNGQYTNYTQQSNASSGYSTTLDEGAYRVAVTAYNTESNTKSQSAWTYFFVEGSSTAPETQCTHYYNAVTLQAPTCTSDGIYSLSCSMCGEYRIVTGEELSSEWLYYVPSGLNGGDFESRTMYRYRDYSSGGWKTMGTYSINYVETWPSGFDTTSNIYSQYNNYGKKVDAYENSSHKLTVNSDSLTGYLYYHWCYDGYAYTVDSKSGSYTRFHAYYSTKTPDQADKSDASDNSYRFDDSTACDDSVWYFCVPVYTQSYTTYQSNTGWGDWSEWSTNYAASSASREVQSVGMYRYQNTASSGHNYQAVVTNPTCNAQGYTTYTCISCGHSYVGDYTGGGSHSYQTIVTPSTCEGSGFTTKVCTACGYSTKIAYTNPLGHNYVSGKCTTCGVADPSYTPGATVPTLTLKSPTLEFKDMITVNAFYTAENIQDVVEMGMITYSTKVSSWSVATAEHVIPGATYNESTGRYVSSSQGIHAKYLGDTVYLAIYAKLNDGTYAYSKLAGYSPVQYATSQLKGTDTKLKQLVVAMLNYGAEAQLYFGHNTGNLANATLSAEQKALPAAYNSGMVSTVASAPAEKQGIFANNQGFSKRTPSISFEGAFSINYFFTPKYTPDSGITMYYLTAEDYNANSVLTTSNATGKIKLEGSGTGQYQGDIEGIAAKALSEAVYVACAYKSGGTVWTSGVLGYSIGAYCSSQASKGNAISNLAMATAVYGYQAKQYFG